MTPAKMFKGRGKRHAPYCPEATYSRECQLYTVDMQTLQCYCFSKEPWCLSQLEKDDLIEKKRVLNQKITIVILKIRDLALKASEVEGMLRDLGAPPMQPLPENAPRHQVRERRAQDHRLCYLRSRRELICSQHSVYMGSLYLHLKYFLVLQKDLKLVESWLHSSLRPRPAGIPLPYERFDSQILQVELEMEKAIQGVSDLASIHLYNWYGPQEGEDSPQATPRPPFSLVNNMLEPFCRVRWGSINAP